MVAKTKKDYVYKHGDAGEDILACVHLAEDGDKAARPIAIYIHGGSFVIGSREMLPAAHLDKLLQLGFVVVSTDYRLCPTISCFDGPVTDTRQCYTWVQTALPALLKHDFGVEVDPKRLVVWGHSAGSTLALLMASMPQPPLAILDMFGPKYFDEPEKPMPAMAAIPDFDAAFLARIWHEVPPPSASALPMTPAGPDFSTPRACWLFDVSKRGTTMRNVVPDGRYDRVDPARLLRTTRPFPPTCFVHGTADGVIDVEKSRRAHAELRAAGAETELHLVEGADHGFDMMVSPGDEMWEPVCKGLEFLGAHV